MAMNVASDLQHPEERRLATVLFADILGFSDLAEQIDFEDISDLTKDIWQWVDSLLEEHGAYIDKHIGDAVMAVWGAPQAGEDDVEHVVTAGLALHCTPDMYSRATSASAMSTQLWAIPSISPTAWKPPLSREPWLSASRPAN